MWWLCTLVGFALLAYLVMVMGFIMYPYWVFYVEDPIRRRLGGCLGHPLVHCDFFSDH